MLSSSSATNGFIPCSSSSSSSKSKKRVFFLDVNPLCYEGSKPSLKCFGKWLSLFLSPQVTHTHPVVAVIDGERGSQHRRNLIPSYKANRCSSTSFSISTSPGHVGRFQPLITRVLHKCNVPKKAADVSPQLKGSSIFLVGMKSSLKTNLGKLLADELRYYYFDSDDLVEEALGGASVAKSIKERDELSFLESETEVLKQLSAMGRLVVCAGNGAVQNSTNLALLRHGITLWIDLPLDIVARDVSEDQIQFSSGSYPEVMDELGALYNKHKDGYATADAIISLQKVASQLGYDNLDDVTTEDMTLEVIILRLKDMHSQCSWRD
ncbi:probable inactive shikimate kinase like 1, chloroplastic isoform X2 [Cicer arietinum]|uniref:Probable inactive shikimate kinase like 1, chloroplastic isoform X2 n=1 Tax=Cicer arietinum TaxID=3827 RepID=A0A1S3EHZ7_CICAR|nr:probable inactive shikimate kinase like 1, chloroplastic isoform X2 [Cicer arietinum]